MQRPGGTPHGISTALELAWGCPRRAYLNKFNRVDEELEDPHLLPFRGDKPAPTLVGTFGHGLMEQYYGKRITGYAGYEPSDFVQWIMDAQKSGPPGPALKEALRCFAFYRVAFPNHELGTPIAVEYDIEIQDDAFGLNPFTCRIDLVTRATKKDVKVIEKSRKVTLEPGTWLNDHKFLGRWAPTEQGYYTGHPQAYAYWKAYNYDKTPSKQAQGFSYNIITKTQAPRFYTIPRRYPSVIDEEIFKHTAAICKARGWPIDKKLRYQANPLRCYDWHKECHWLATGACKRF